MSNIYEDQARHFANEPLIRREIVASVHLEDSEDKPFWNALLQSRQPGQYYFITHSKSQKGRDSSGCEQCLKYRSFLSKRFFIGIDSDMRYLMQEQNIDAEHFICQTYTYSWENHFCEANELQKRFEVLCPEKAATFNFPIFLNGYSKAIFKPLLLLLHCLKNGKNDFNQGNFRACLPNQCRRDELLDNGKPLIEKIARNFEPYLQSVLAKAVDFELETVYCKSLNVTEQNAYLHIRGHNLYDLIAYIGNLLCRGTKVSFLEDVLVNQLPSLNYWQIEKAANDIDQILKG
jgi:hypothetical protein